jgi:hypothetical protein
MNRSKIVFLMRSFGCVIAPIEIIEKILPGDAGDAYLPCGRSARAHTRRMGLDMGKVRHLRHLRHLFNDFNNLGGDALWSAASPKRKKEKWSIGDEGDSSI